MKGACVAALVLSLALPATAALAEPSSGTPLRLIGQAPDAREPLPKSFVIDAQLKRGDDDAQSTLEGWFSAAEAPALSGEVSGTCVERHCALTVDVDGGKLHLTGEFRDAAGATPAHFLYDDDQGKLVQQGGASVTPLAGPVRGLGQLAAPDAIAAPALDELLMWSQESVSSGSPPSSDDPPSSLQRESLASWQGEQQRLATGLIFTSDLAQLRTAMEAARKTAGWTALGDPSHGWSAGYPATLLPKASRSGAEQRFASADGKAVLIVAVDPPMTSQAFDAFVEATTADRLGREGVNLTRVNNDMEMRYLAAGVVTVGAWRNREGGLARVVLTYPADRDSVFQPYEAILQHSLVAADDLKR